MKKKKESQNFIRPHDVYGNIYYCFEHGADKPIYLGDAMHILQAVEQLNKTTSIKNRHEYSELKEEIWRLQNKLAATQNEYKVLDEQYRLLQTKLKSVQGQQKALLIEKGQKGIVYGD